MKYNFEDNNIIVGHIKELLHSFNLPMIPIYTDNTVLYKDRAYIKENKIVKWDGEKFITLADYIYNWPMVNLTKKLKMTSAIYDDYTHEYLGDYLRFIRDYHHIDLMSMYNCFGKRSPSRIYYTQKFNNGTSISLDTDNTNFNYYIVPIKFNQTYTIAVDADIRWELVSIIYSNIFVENAPESLIEESYRTVSGSKFTKPFLYSTNFSCADKFWSKEKNLMLLLKIPSEIKSSIVILEGNYSSLTNIVDGTQMGDMIVSQEIDGSGDDIEFNNAAEDEKIQYDFKNSLLFANLENSYPFSDRLVEYLLGNAITPLDEFRSDVARVQEIVYEGSINGYYGIWDDKLTNNIHKLIMKPDLTKSGTTRVGNTIIKFDAEETTREEGKYTKRFIDVYDDVIGYVDKDVETLLRLQ